MWFLQPNIPRLLERRDIPALTSALEHRKYEVKLGAQKALETLGEADAWAVPQLCSQIGESKLTSNQVYTILKTLGKIRGAGAVETVSACMKMKNSSVRQEAACTLGKLRDAAARPALLVAAQEDDDPGVVRESLKSLSEIGGEGAIVGLERALSRYDRDGRIKKSALDQAAGFGPNAVGPIIRLLRSDPGDLTWSAMCVLEQIGNANTARELLAIVKEKAIRDELSRGRIVEAAAALGGKAVVDELFHLAIDTSESESARSGACRGLAKIGGPVASAKLADVRSSERIQAMLMLFSSPEFDGWSTLQREILFEMKTFGRSYQDWLTTLTPVEVIFGHDVVDMHRVMATALIKFRVLLGDHADIKRGTSAPFTATRGVTGVVLAHWREFPS